MWLEDFTPDIESSEWAWNSAESTKENSEKQKESSKKAQAKIAKTKKDETKAKKYDFLLAGFLVKIIVDKKYDVILSDLFQTIHKWYPSNFVLWVLSLINIEISNKIREIWNKENITFDYIKKNLEEDFNDNKIDPKIKSRINNWVEDIIDSTKIEYSIIQTKKLKNLLKDDDEILLNYTSKTFSFFLKEININISKTTSENISEFILNELKKWLDKLKLENF